MRRGGIPAETRWIWGSFNRLPQPPRSDIGHAKTSEMTKRVAMHIASSNRDNSINRQELYEMDCSKPLSPNNMSATEF